MWLADQKPGGGETAMEFSDDENMTTYVTLNLNCAVPVVQGELDVFWVTL